MPDSATVHDVWGPEVVPIPLTEVTERMADLDEGEVADAIASLTAGAVEIVEPTERELADVGRIYVALRGVVDAYALDAVTVRCFDLLLECKATGCFGLAELTDTGVIAGCEGDLVSTIGLLWAQLLTGETPWMANPAQVDEGENALWVAHCTVPRTIVEKYRLRSHFESGIGVGIQGELPPGPVTLVRLGGRGLDELWLAEGEITKSGDAEDLCRTQAFVRLRSGHVSELLRHPLGNHLVVVRGHHADRLQTWFDSML
jgi:L-fucose isomerase-like protein